jgi:hypothetical protein
MIVCRFSRDVYPFDGKDTAFLSSWMQLFAICTRISVSVGLKNAFTDELNEN